jgi:uridylate kinase
MSEYQYRRVLLKLSGEALQGDQGFGVSEDMLGQVADQLAQVQRAGVQLGLVVGGGNFFRGVAGAARGMDRVHADRIGMLATCMNALTLREALADREVPCEVLSAIPLGTFARLYDRDDAVQLLEGGAVTIFAAGTGSPYFSTDTAASLRAVEIGADALLKATKVDGVYDRDPAKYEDAIRLERLTYRQVVEQQLRVMDLTAVTLCREAGMTIRVFDLFATGSIMGVLRGEALGSTIEGGQ